MIKLYKLSVNRNIQTAFKILDVYKGRHYHIIMIIFLYLLTTCFSVIHSNAQTDNTKQQIVTDSTSKDTSAFKNFNKLLKQSTLPTKPYSMTKSPMGAIWRSLVLPGLGQYYVGSYWKAPLFLAGAGTIGYFIYFNNSKYLSYRNQIQQIPNGDPKDPNIQILISTREFYRDNRDMSIFYLAGVYILAAVDAYVDANLYDFSVDDSVSFYVNPAGRDGVVLGMQIRW